MGSITRCACEWMRPADARQATIQHHNDVGMEGAPMAGRRVLVVDDSWTDLTLMATTLRQGGYDVMTASDGEGALTMATTERPDCIVLDVVLPRQNGFQLCRHLKQTAQTRDIPVIMVSVKNTPADQHWAIQQGAARYLIKPFDASVLLQSVQSVL